MNSQEELLSFLDLLDLDEEMIDSRLKSIMVRSSYTNEHLSNALQLLRYKHLINKQEETDCDNAAEFDFIAKLIRDIHQDTVEITCKIINVVLSLNGSTLVSYSEHLLLQILSNLDLTSDDVKSSDSLVVEQSKTMLHLKVCDSILDAVINHKEKLTMLFLEAPLEEIICGSDEQLKIHLISNTVPKLVEGIVGYNILDRIWVYLKHLNEDKKGNALKVLSCLSDYYLPITDSKGNAKFESEIVHQYDFWSIVLYGLISTDSLLRKISVYLAKRAIDSISNLKVNIIVKNYNQTIFSWEHKKSSYLNNQWDNFFILIDSLEEKQCNIVLPSLQLFDTLTEIGDCWLNCAFNIGLRHDNSLVRLKCVKHRLKTKLNSVLEAVVLLEALNDINFYENPLDCIVLKGQLLEILRNESNLIHILEAIPQAHLSPVPFYHITDILTKIDKGIRFNMNNPGVIQIFIELLKTPCNIIAVRRAMYVNIANFVAKSCNKLHWKAVANIFSVLQLELTVAEKNPLLSMMISDLSLTRVDKKEFFKYVTESHLNIDIGLLYLDNNQEDISLFTDMANEKIKAIQNAVNRQYSNKMETFNDILYILKLVKKCDEINNTVRESVKLLIMREFKNIVQYTFCLLTSDTNIKIDDIKALFEDFNILVNTNEEDLRQLLLQLYKTSVMFLKDSRTDVDKIAFSMFIINNLNKNNDLVGKIKHEMLGLNALLQLAFEQRKVSNAQSVGRLRNVFYEKHCETVYLLLQDEQLTLDRNIKEIANYIEKIIESGGYGCLKWILKIVNKIVDALTNSEDINFNVSQFVNRMWTEIEELKSNNQYSPCMEEFVNLITHKALIEKPEYSNTIILFCSKIIEYGPAKNSPLYYLVRKLNENKLKENGHLVYILCETLLYNPVPRKDQRIADNLALDILKDTKYGILNDEIDLYFNFEIQYFTVSMLSRTIDDEILQVISSFIKSKIDCIFKYKQRYHGNSQIHRTFQTGLQHLLFILLLKPDLAENGTSNWCLDLLGRLPHQLSVRICLEWYISLSFYLEKVTLAENLLLTLKSKNVPLTSQFAIIYWLLKRKISNGSHTNDEYEFVMDVLLSHTMGQMFNIRLQAQFLATKLYEFNNNPPKYQYVVDIIENTLAENAKDKNFVKLKKDYFVNDFDIVCNLTPYFIYHMLPRICDVNNNENVDMQFIAKVIDEINENVEHNGNDEFKNEWAASRIKDAELDDIQLNKNIDTKTLEEVELIGTIQKKYIPWKNMSDVNVYNVEKKKESPSDLIVVASLINKLPNLGGMARTSEVFGVKTYVIDSLRHLHDKQFQGLSVSAERWIDVEEIRPGPPLKEYLARKKADGYSVIAAEQTSTSHKLQMFKFPKKTLLLLGHEKEGVPCDLLPMMDFCVEIPQQGFVRSLNVHVTAAIFVWEYVRQNLL